VDSSKEQQASAFASAAKKQGRRRRRLFSSPLSVKLQRPAPVVKALEREVDSRQFSLRPLDSPPDSVFLSTCCSGVRHRPLGARPTPFHA